MRSVSVSVTEEIDLAKVDDDAELIAVQGIDIFDKDSAFYTDVCFIYDSPNGRDATPTDRLNTYYPNISLCETGCTYDEVKRELNENIISGANIPKKDLENI